MEFTEKARIMTAQNNQPLFDPERKTTVGKKSKGQFLAWSVFNRDLMQIEFFRRLLEEAADKSIPLLERLKFLSVFSSNLDEFFMNCVRQSLSDGR